MTSFTLQIWFITFIDVCMLNHPCIPGINSLPFDCCEWSSQCALKIFENFVENFFTCVQQKYWPMILVLSLNSFGIRVMLASSNEFVSVSPFSLFWKILRRTGINSSLNVGWEFTHDAICFGALLCWELFDYWFNHFTSYRPVPTSYFFMFHS